MEFRRTITLEKMWILWAVVLFLWLCFAGAVWNMATLFFKILLCLVVVFAAVAAVYFIRPRYIEFVVDDESIRWGALSSTSAMIGDVKKILYDESTASLYVELTATAAKRVCAPGHNVEQLPRGFSRTEFLSHMREHHPSVPIEVVTKNG